MIVQNMPRQSSTVAGHDRDAVDQVVKHVKNGICCALLGTRYSGKTELLRSAQTVLRQELAQICLYVNLHDVEASTQTGFFASLVSITAQQILELTGTKLPLPTADRISSAAFRGFVTDSITRIDHDLVLIIDHLEALPNDLVRALLTALRAVYMERRTEDHIFVAVVAGAFSLATVTVGESSPFHNIAETVLVGNITEDQSAILIEKRLSSNAVKASEAAQAQLLGATCGDPYLIERICDRCAVAALDRTQKRLTVRTVNRVIHEFIDKQALSCPPLQEAVKLLEDDPDLLRCVLLLLQHDTVPIRELSLPLSTDLDPLYLTGVVTPIADERYQIRNGIYRRFLKKHFDPGRVGYLLTMAGRWDSAIDYLESSVGSGNDQYRPDLLAATINSMYASEDVHRAAHYLARGLSAAFGIQRAKIWHISPDQTILQLIGQIGPTTDGSLPVSQRISVDEDRLETRAYREASPIRGKEQEEGVKRAIPLLAAGSQTAGVVTVCEPLARERLIKQRERDRQLVGYLNQAARAIRDVSVRQKQAIRIRDQDIELDRKARQLSLLHRVSTLVQTMDDLEKILNVVLTGITAHYGLGFNRVWLFLLNRHCTRLHGRMAIGELAHANAYRDWEHAAKVSFDDYVERLRIEDKVEVTAIDPPTRDLKIPVTRHGDDAFSRVAFRRHTLRWSNASDVHGTLPQEFQAHFQVEEAVMAPLLAKGECLGIIVADNKFSNRTYTNTDEEMLATFANQAAVAIMNAQQRREEQRQIELAETLRDIATAIGRSLNPREVLDLILEHMARVLPFDTASIQLLDSSQKSLKIIASKGFGDPANVETLTFPIADKDAYPNTQVWHQNTPLCFGNVRDHFPHFGDPTYQATRVHSWLGAPLMVGDKTIGVITLDSFTADAYTEEHKYLAMVFASQAAVAIKNARMFEQAKRRAEELETLAEAAEEISAIITEHPPKLLDLLVRSACKLNGAKCAVIYPFLPGKLVYDRPNIASFGLLHPEWFDPKDKHRQENTSLARSVVDKGMRVVSDVTSDPDSGLPQAPFIQREKIKAFVGISLYAGNEPLGVLFVNFRDVHEFTDEELDTIRRFGNLAAFAILNARLYRRTYEALQKRIAELETIQDIDDAITRTLDLHDILEMILERALQLTDGSHGTVQLLNDDNETLELVAARGATLVSIGERLKLGEGITGIAAKEGRTYRIPDLQPAEWQRLYRPYIPDMRSALVVPMPFENRIVGVINIESPSVGTFNKDDERLLNGLARQAAIAIQNAKQYEALRDAQDELLAAGAIAWMGLFGSEWSHTVAQKTFSIRSYVDVLKDIAPRDDLIFKQALDNIEIIAQEIQDVPLTISSPPDAEKGEPLLVDLFVREWLEGWCAPHAHIHLELDLSCSGVLVRADETLLKMALQKLVDNAIRHTPESGTMKVETHIESDEFVAIALQDSGSGIPDEYKPLFGRRRIPKPEDESGSGMGALLAGFILRKYGGELKLVWSRQSEGTRLEITLPRIESPLAGGILDGD